MKDKKQSKKVRVLVLLSGGLDSMLAVKLLQEQGIEVAGISFESCFFGTQSAEKAAKQLNIELCKIDFKKDHLDMLKNPEHGYGRNFNPCIDCHLLMVQKAGEIMKKEKFDFIATGEVLGERPFSQRKWAMDQIEKKSNIAGYVLRPLSAKLMEPTIQERQGLIDREKLLDIQGRSRKKQIELAEKFGLKEYPWPAGGCLLTIPESSKRIMQMLEHWPDCDIEDIELAKFPRNFWRNNNLIVIGRNEKENEAIEKIANEKDILIKMKNAIGPSALIRIKNLSSAMIGNQLAKKSALAKAKELIIKFAGEKAKGKNIEFEIKSTIK